MITVGVIRSGKNYLSRHLVKNDYWSEGEKAIQGEWVGLAAERLGLAGPVEADAFDALRQNRYPHTGERLTARDRQKRAALFDIQLSAPKDVSILAMVGGDGRIRQAFLDSVKTTLQEMERFAAVRERRGQNSGTEAFRQTGNFVGAMFLHDASRDLDPQLHVHAVFANATWDAERGEWLALQHAEMLRASPYLRQVLYRELAGRLRALGYEPYDFTSTGFSVRGVEHLRERYSKRTREVKALAEKFEAEKGRKPTKREVEVLVRESRPDKLAETTTEKVRAQQRAQLNEAEAKDLDRLVTRARAEPEREQWSQGERESVLEAALRHVFERRSVAREGEILSAALELHPDFFRWRELREALEGRTDIIRLQGELTLRKIWQEERSTAERARLGRNQRFPLGSPSHLPPSLKPGQLAAARTLLENRDFMAVLVGDAGTGKTTLLQAVQAAHRSAVGQAFVSLAPTTKARDALIESGFAGSETVQHFLASERLQGEANGRVILVDEAGLLSTQVLDRLSALAQSQRARLLLVGDTKQHFAVERGDALRQMVRYSGLPVVRLSEVLRQRDDRDRQFARLLAAGHIGDAFQYAERQGLFRETPNDAALFTQAAEHYVRNRLAGIETLVVIPFWEEIDRFSAEVRPTLRKAGLLGETEIVRPAVRPLTWTEEQKKHWHLYQPGDQLLFLRKTRWHEKGSAAEVIAILPGGLRVRDRKGRESTVNRRLCGAYDVGRRQVLPLSEGEQVLIRGREDSQGFTNGEVKTVGRIESDRVTFTDGTTLPPDFAAWTYGHAVTAYRSQGSSSEESLLLLGPVAEKALLRRQFYVGNTRYKGSHAIYMSDREAILRRVAQRDPGRELATEFTRRHQISEAVNQRAERRKKHILRVVWEQFRTRLRRRRAQTVEHHP